MAYGRLATVLGTDGTGPDAYRRSMEAAAAQGVVGLVDLEFSGGVADWAARWAEGADLLRIRHACYADGLDDVLAARPALRRPARRRPAAHHGPAEDHQRRLAQHPYGLVLRAVRREGRAGRRGGPAQPDPRGAARAARPRRRRRARRRRPRHRRPRRRPRRWPPSRPPVPAAASSTCSSPPATTCAGWPPRRPRERAARPPARRPRRHRAAVARARRALLPAAVDARRRASTWCWAPTPRSRRSTRGWRSRRRCTAPATSASRGTPSSRSPPARRSPPRPTAGAPSPSATRGDLVLLDADPLDGGSDRRARGAAAGLRRPGRRHLGRRRRGVRAGAVAPASPYRPVFPVPSPVISSRVQH